MTESPCSITEALRDTIVRLETKLKVSSDNKGAQFKINTHANWNYTIGLRCNHVYLEAVAGYIQEVVTSLATHQTLPLLEYISVARAHQIDPTTARKRSVPWQKTLFITFRPPRPTFEHLRKTLPAAVENYMELEALLAALEHIENDNL